MADGLADLRNLGPATARMLTEVDISTAERLREVGAVEAYRRLKFRFGRQVTAVALYAMEAALRGCHWLDLSPAEREALKNAADGRAGERRVERRSRAVRFDGAKARSERRR